MDDQILQIAFTIYHNPRAYALLLGSGISRSAGILTGQQIMEDLIRKVAYLKRESIKGEPADWYENSYHEKSGYDTIIKRLGGNPVDRSNILRKYFERQPDDEGDVKLPTSAHRAIAILVKEGYIQVVLTTNFDRLLEQALEAEGIHPYVITTEQDAFDTPPIQHLPVTIVKLHGDYLESNIRNTAEELAKYDVFIEKLLDKILSEWGLIVCGWSGEYDTALREGFSRSPKCHYATHWVNYKGDVKPEAKAIIDKRQGKEISTDGADIFFNELEQNVMALKSLDSTHELSPKVAAERVRRLLSTNDFISLETWLNTELEQAYRTFTSQEFKQQVHSSCPDWNNLEECVGIVSSQYFTVLETPLHMIATLCWHGKDNLHSVLANTLSHWIEIPVPKDTFAYQHLPIFFVIYTVGISVLESENWQYLQSIFFDPYIPKKNPQDFSNILVYLYEETFRRYRVPGYSITLGKSLNSLLRSVFPTPLITSDERYNRAFDLFEMILNLAYLASPERDPQERWMPYHVNLLENRSWDYLIQYLGKASQLGNDWGLLQTRPFSLKGNDFGKLLNLYCSSLEERKSSDQLLRFPSDFAQAYKRPGVFVG